MSREGVEVVGRLLAADDGENVLPRIEETLQRVGPDPQQQTAIKVLAEDEVWRLCSPEIVWDMSATGLGSVAHGARELCQWWSAWVPAWTRYVYRVDESRDLDEWVLTKGEVVATARNGQAVEMPVWQLWKVADGHVTVMRAFLTEADALAAAV
jgi:ketosteroid isomerase-like protein